MELIKIKDKGLDVVPYIVKRLKEGKIVISPTDTVYGIICDGWNDLSKERIFEVKRRKREKVLTGFVRDIEEAKKFAEIDGKKEEFVKKKWPGRYTFIFRAKRKINFIVSSSNEIGIRIPDHPFLLEVLKHFEILASTSANLSGENSPSCIDEIDEELKERVDIVVDGGRTDGRESTIWKFVNDKMKLLRGNILFVCEG
ncbi:MAG TPA: threonylcarbamoyl-AMP synthase, partial [bacterium]|nr:threonylcarbamoyl-AMP synthase [bacterium]